MSDTTELLRQQAFNLSCDEQFRLATFIAENLGYVLTPEPAMDSGPTLEERVKRLEILVSRLNVRPDDA